MFIFKKMLFLIILVLSINSFCFGTSIDWQLGARPQGMGSAFTALSDDANACYWNPAGLSQLKKEETTFMYKFSELNYNFTYLAHVHLLKNSAIGFSRASVTSILEQGRENEKTKMTDDIYSLGYGRKIKNIFLGVNIKQHIINSNIGGGSGLGFDGGFLFFPKENFSIGIVAKNINSNVNNEIFPCFFKIGIASKFFKDNLKCALDVFTKSEVEEKPLNIFFNFGIECKIFKKIALRMGMEKNNFCGGIGIQHNQYKFDYAYLPAKITKNSQAISLSIIW